MSDGSSDGGVTRGKLDAEQAHAIAECIALGERQTVIAERFGVSAQTVRAIKRGTRWAEAIDDDLRARMRAASSPPIALDETAAKGVMAALRAGRSGQSIAQEYGISPSMVSAIKHGRAWSSLDPELSERLSAGPRRGKVLTEERVAQIRRRLAEGASSRMVAAEFEVSASTVLAIKNGRTWG